MGEQKTRTRGRSIFVKGKLGPLFASSYSTTTPWTSDRVQLNMSGNRPEHIAPPEVVRLSLSRPFRRRHSSRPSWQLITYTRLLCAQFYNATEAKKYSNNSRIQNIQAEMTYRCLELLDLCAVSYSLSAYSCS